MVEPSRVPGQQSANEATERIEYGWFAGILEGRVGDRARLEQALDRLREEALSPVDLTIDGARFSMLFDETTIPGERITMDRLGRLVDGLQGLVAAAADPGAVESTVRCTLVGERETIETLFAPLDGRIETVSRSRAVESADRERAPRPPLRLPLDGMSTRRVVLLGALLLVGLALLAWRSGLVDRLMGVAAAGLEHRTGAFGRLISIEVEGYWGNYRVTLRRGPDYPQDLAAAERLRAGARTAVERAAINAVADGEAIYLQLRDGSDEVQESARVELGALLTRADGEVVAILPGRIGAASIETALDPGKEAK